MVDASVKQNRQITWGAFSNQSKRRLQCLGKKLCECEFVNKTWCSCCVSQKPDWLKKYKKWDHLRSSPKIPPLTIYYIKASWTAPKHASSHPFQWGILQVASDTQNCHCNLAVLGIALACAMPELFKAMSNSCGCIRRDPMKDEWRHWTLANKCAPARHSAVKLITALEKKRSPFQGCFVKNFASLGTFIYLAF